MKSDAEQEVKLPAKTPEDTRTEYALMTATANKIANMFLEFSSTVEQMAASMQAMAQRMNELEELVRISTPVTGKQAQFLHKQIRARAVELLQKRGIDDKKALNKTVNAIRKSVLVFYGVGCLQEIPRHEYQVAMTYIDRWNNLPTILEIVKEVNQRALETAGQPANLDASQAGKGAGR